jgi:hypothetical protein
MSRYVITIVQVAEDDSLAGPVAQTIVQVATDSGQPEVKEITVRAADHTSLTGGLPYVDFELLMRAFIPPAEHQPAPAVIAPPAPAAPATPARTPSRTATEPKRGTAQRPVRSREAASSALSAARAYRKAPDDETLEAVYAQVGTVNGVAAHFDVPVHTAQGWISRMRRKHSQVGVG